MTPRPSVSDSSLWRNPGVVMLLVVQLLMSIRDMPLGSFFVVYLQSAGYAATTITQVVSGAQIAGMLVAVVAGRLAQRQSSKRLWVIGIAVSALSALVFHATVAWWVVLCWLIGGAGASLASISGSSVLTMMGRQQRIGTLSSLFVICFTVGGVIGSPFAGWLIDQGSYTGYSAVLLGFSLAGMVLIWRFIPDTPVAEPPTVASSSGFDWAFFRRFAVLAILGMRGLATINYGMMLVMVPLLINRLTSDLYVVALYGSVMLFVSSIAQFLTGRAADRWGAKWPTIVAFAVMIACGIVLSFGAESMTVLFVGGVISNAAAWALLTLMYLWVADWVTPTHHPLLFGWLHAVWNVCMVLGSLIGGALVDMSSGLPFVVTGLLNIASLALVTRLYRQAPPALPITTP